MFKLCLFVTYSFLSLSLTAEAQSVTPLGSEFPVPSQASARAQRRNLGSPEAEMLERARIRHEKASHEELLDRAGEVAKLGTQLRAAFESKGVLSREELKKIERVEQLVRKIRGGIGGSEDKTALKDPPERMEEAVERFASLAESLNEDVKKTTRHVVSGSVINCSNQLIELIRHLRTLSAR